MLLRALPVVACALLVASAALGAETAVVRDAAGTVVGTILSGAPDAEARYDLPEDSLVWIATPVPGAPGAETTIRLLIGVAGPWDTKELSPLLYESDDCTGPPLVEASADPDAPRGAVIFGTELFWADEAAARRAIRSQASLLRSGEACDDVRVAPEMCCARLTRAQPSLAAPVTGASLASLGLQPPFRLDRARAD